MLTRKITHVRLRQLAMGLFVLAIALNLGTLIVSLQTPGSVPAQYNSGQGGLFFVLASITFGAIGFLVARKQPSNAIGWMLLGIGTCIPLGISNQYVIDADYAPQSFPAPEVAALLGNAAWYLAVALMLSVFLIFPDGKLLSRRWRWFARLAVVATVAGEIGSALDPQGLDNGPTRLHNPIGITAAAGVVEGVFLLGTLALVAVLVAGLVSQVHRYRHGGAELRHQLKWVITAVVVLIATIVFTFLVLPLLSAPGWIGQLIDGFGYFVIPCGIGVSVLKYRLYDIDVVISRTLVYGSLAAFITTVYVGIAVGLGSLVGSGGKPNLGLSILATGVVAAGFQPARERLQKVANRLVYGKRATPYEVLSQFSERVAESYASDDVLPRMARVLADGTNAHLARVWLRSGSVLQPVTSFPPQPSVPAVVHLNGAAELSIPATDRAVLVRHQGEVLGALTVTKRSGEAITPIEVKLMDDLAHQAGLVLKNVGLTADLQARLVDLRASRQRLVAAQDDERRRLERNLHDGAQQHLVAIKVKLGLAQMLATRDPERAMAAIGDLKDDADEALETLRDLARGIYPPLLADRGLPTALQAQARKATLPVTIDADGIGRYPEDIEAAVYFCVLEALQNVQKYAHASAATVRLRTRGEQLIVEVTDDGRGFDVSATARGNGLTNMEDRLDAVGGTLQIASRPGDGTTLRATILVAQVLRPSVEGNQR